MQYADILCTVYTRLQVASFQWTESEDIYSYNLATDEEKKLNAADGQHRQPNIDGRYVVWFTSPEQEVVLYDLNEDRQEHIGDGSQPQVGLAEQVQFES